MKRILLLLLFVLIPCQLRAQALNNGIAPVQNSQQPLFLQVTDGDLTSVLGRFQFKSQNIALAPNATNYVYLDLVPTVPTLTVNQTGFPAANIYQVAIAITNNNTITSMTDARPPFNSVAFSGGGGGGGTIGGSGTLNTVTCWAAATTIANCPDITDVAGAPTVSNTLTVTGSGPAGISMQELAPAGCKSPTAGFQILCAINSPDSLVLSSNGGAYAAIGSGGGGGSPPFGSAGDLQFTDGTNFSNAQNLFPTATANIDGFGTLRFNVPGNEYFVAGAAAQLQAQTNLSLISVIGALTLSASNLNTLGGGANQLNIGSVGAGGILGLVGSTNGTATITAPASANTTSNPFVFSNAISVPSCTGCGALSGLSTNGVVYGTSTTTAASITAPAVNGIYNCGYTVSASTAVTPTCPQVGIAGRSIIAAATTDTVLYSDNATVITHDNAASGTVNQTLPTATTLGNPFFVYSYANHSAQTDTITPTTWTIQLGSAAAGASIIVPTGAFVRIKIDPNNGSNWLADCAGCSVGTFTTLTLSGNGAASTPALSMTGVPFAGTNATSFPLLYINNTGASATSSLSTSGTAFGINAAPGLGQAIAVFNNGGPCTFCVSPAGAVVSAGSMLPTGALQAGSNVLAAGVSALGFVGRTLMHSPADGRIIFQSNALAANGLTRATFGTEAAANPAFCFDGSTAAIIACDGTGTTANGIVKTASLTLTGSGMTGTSCLEEISGVVTATGLTCSGSGNASPVFSTTDTLTNASLTSEQLFASNISIPANTITANVSLPFNITLDIVTTGTGANAQLRLYLCPTQGSLTGCVKIYNSASTTPAITTFSNILPVMITGTAAAGATATVIAAASASNTVTGIVGQNRQSSIVANVPTNGTLYLQATIQYAATTASDSVTLTSMVQFPVIR